MDKKSLENTIHITEEYKALDPLRPEEANKTKVTKYAVNAASQDDLTYTMEKIEEELEKNNIIQNPTSNITIAISELIQNAQEHTCKFNPEENIYVTIITTPRYLLAGVGSKGQPINTDKVRELLKNYTINSRASRGRGFEMVRRTTDIIYIPGMDGYTDIMIGKLTSQKPHLNNP